MKRKTIDFGIDLGTTNSAIAVMDGEMSRVIKNPLGEDVTASMVNVKEVNGRVLVTVGTRAKNIVMTDRNGYAQVASEFKKRMDQEWHHEFREAGGKWDAPMLSAEVLKYLLESVQGRLNERPKSAVITVPAAFIQRAYEATSKAAELAGLDYVELLAEPVAAAFAYGLHAKLGTQEDWLVYDLGGGTFDASIVHFEDGIFTVVDHEGIRHLGGSHFDEEIVNHFLFKQYPTEMQTEKLRMVLCLWAEQAKISLGIQDVYLFEEKIFGHQLSSIIEISREKIAPLGIKLFEPTVKICKQLLERNDMDSTCLGRVILVGGQTQSPFLRKWLEESLGHQVDISADPLTAIAQGAAIYAGTRLNKNNLMEKTGQKDNREKSIDSTQYTLEINVPVIATEDDVLVTGTVKAKLGGALPVDALSVQIIRVDQSGQIIEVVDTLLIDGKGRFYSSVKLQPGENLFKVILKEESSGLANLANSQFSVRRQNVGVGTSQLTRGLGVVDSEGRMIWFFKRGGRLPVKDKKILYTSKYLKKGEKGAMLSIPIVEGDDDLGELNTLNSRLLIRAESISCDIPEGTDVEVTIAVDDSKRMSICGYIIPYDIEIETSSVGGADLKHDELVSDLGLISQVVKEVTRVADADDQIMEVLDEIGWDETIGVLEELVGRDSKENQDSWQRAKEMIVNIKRQLWPLKTKVEELINWKNHKHYCDKNMSKAQALIETMPELPDVARSDFAHLVDDYERAAKEMDSHELERIAYGALPELFLSVDELREMVASGAEQRPEKERIVIGTEKGDVHEK